MSRHNKHRDSRCSKLRLVSMYIRKAKWSIQPGALRNFLVSSICWWSSVRPRWQWKIPIVYPFIIIYRAYSHWKYLKMGISMTKRLIQTRGSSPKHAKPPLRNATVPRWKTQRKASALRRLIHHVSPQACHHLRFLPSRIYPWPSCPPMWLGNPWTK